jgi:SAM-dependent methyltransferase
MTNNNADQIDYWNGDAGAKWAKRQQRMDALLAPISDAALQACAATRGERVLDVGCGCGETTLRLAARGAHATGVDVSQPMLARARERAAAERVSATFMLGDAAEARFEHPFDHVFSRFGVMFFADPRAAFTNVRKALRASGDLCFVCWQLPQYNPWIATPFAAARPLLPLQPPFDPRAPGPFAFADADYVREILTGAGFNNVRVDPLAAALTLGGDVDSALEMVCDVGPLSRSLAGVDAATRERVVAAVREPLRANATAAGVAFGAMCWIVRAFA